MTSIESIEFDEWDEFKLYIKDNFTVYPAFVFRGQQDSSWDIISTLTRLSESVSTQASALESKQKELFRKRIRGLRGTNPSTLTDDELWSLGQHYGLATPLIDWSDSPYIAAYFAFEQKGAPTIEYRSVYVLKKYSLLTGLKNKENIFIEPLQDDNARILAQAGLFTKIPTGLSFEKWLKENKLEDCLIELRISNYCRLEALNDLRVMNIQANTIYPDLNGAAASCNMWHENVSENIQHSNYINKMLANLNQGIF
jgi:hypothetical protein